MQTDLEAILKDITEKTGVEVSLDPIDGGTEFLLEVGERPIAAYLRGEGEEAERTARLIGYLVSVCEHSAFSDRREELKSILLGEGGGWRAFRFMTKYGVKDGACVALDLVPDRLPAECTRMIEHCVSEGRDFVVPMDDRRTAVVRFLDDEEQSPYDFATFLTQSLYEELGVRAGVGVGCEARSFHEISASYAQAATAIRMSGIFHGEGEVHSYREYLLVRLLEDVPKSRLKDYMEQFGVNGAAEIFQDEDMAQTAEEFLESSLNISETSRNLFMHRNTLSYRLDKIERATGLNIRKFSDAVTFRVITILYKLLQS